MRKMNWRVGAPLVRRITLYFQLETLLRFHGITINNFCSEWLQIHLKISTIMQ